MADIQKTVEIIFGATDSTGNALGNLGNNLNSVEKNLGSITGPLASVTKGLLANEAAIIALAAAYGGFAISKSIEFKNAQIDLAKVLNSTDPAVESFTQTVLDLSEQYGVASSSVLQGIANFKQAGFSAEDSAKLQKTALDLIIAGDVEAARASDILVASLKGFSAEADQSTRFVEALNNVSNQYATDLGELATGMSRISPVANKMGFSFEEATGLITPIIEVFRSGPEAANALRTGLLKLIDDAGPVGEALKLLGVSQLDLNGQMRSGRDIFLDVATAFKTLDENQKLVVTSQIVGTEQAAKMVTVFDNLQAVQDITAVAMERTGSVTQEVALRLNSAGKQVDITVQSFNNLSKSVGDELLPSFVGVSQGTQDILQAFRDVVASGGLAPLFDSIESEGLNFAQFLKDIAVAIPDAFNGLDFDGLIDSFSDLQDSVESLFGGIDLTTADGLQQALQNLVDFISLLTNASSGAVRGLQPLIDGVVSFLQALANSDADTQGFIGKIGGIATAVDTVLPLLGFLASALSVVGGTLVTIAGLKSVSFFKGIASSLVGISPTNVALAGAIGAVTFAVNENIDAFEELQARENSIASDEEHLNDTRGKIAKRLAEITTATGITVNSMDDLNSALSKGSIVIDDSELGYRNGADAIDQYGTAVSDAVDGQDSWADSVSEASSVLDGLGVSVDGTSVGLGGLSSEQVALNAALKNGISTNGEYGNSLVAGVKSLKDFSSSSTGAVKTLEEVSEAAVLLSEREKLAIKQTNELELQLNQLASNERIATLEFTAEIKVAEFEAQAKQVVAQLDAMAEGLSSNNDLIGELFSHDAPDWDSFGFETEEAIEEANKRANDLNDSIVSLNNAQIDNINAKTEALRTGGAVINVNADGLQPELEAVLKSLLEFIQIEANAEGLEILI